MQNIWHTDAPSGPEAPALAGTLQRVGALAIDARVGVPDGPGWITRDELLAPAVLDAAMALVGRGAGTDLAAVQATWLLEGYAFALTLPALAALLSEGRAPDLAPGNVALHRGKGGRMDAVSFRSPRMWVLPDDAQARTPGALVAASPAALAGHLRAALVAHLGPLVDALRPRAHRGARALWASVEDTVSGGLLSICEGLGDARDATRWADLMLGVEAPLSGRAAYVEVVHAGGRRTIRRRAGCCLAYRCLAGGGTPCLSCPRTSPAERRPRLEAAARAR
jgi:ferric iron reductase protein FhuF